MSNTVQSIAGEYYLTGMMEMASAFRLSADGTFQFFFSYGALDRYGSGHWKIEGNTIILNGATAPVADFTLLSSGRMSEDYIKVHIKEPNTVLRRHVYGSLDNGNEGTWKQANQEGEMQFDRRDVTTISVALEFCPERVSTIAIENPSHNDFVLALNSTVMEVFLKDFALDLTADGLHGKHPLLEGQQFNYRKT